MSSLVLLTTVAVLAGPNPVVGASFTIPQWTLGIGVNPPGSGGGDSHVFTDVQNPFYDSHSAVVDQSTAESSYQFSWAGDAGSFLIEATHQAEGVPSLSLLSSSSGFIWMTPTEQLSLSITAEYTYSLPADPMLAALAVTVFDADEPLYELFGENESYDTTYGAPATGTFSIDGLLTLPPNHTWVLAYSMRITTATGTSGHMATGSGFVDFQITPEPTTLCLLALGALGLLKRSRSRCR